VFMRVEAAAVVFDRVMPPCVCGFMYCVAQSVLQKLMRIAASAAYGLP